MACDRDRSDPRLEPFCSFLELLARARLDPRLRDKLDPADLVLRTLLRAVAAQKRFRGDDAGRAAGLQPILARLPDDQRRAVELRHLQSLFLAEIAVRMRRSVDAVVGLIHRGLRALRRDLEELRGEMGAGS
jgi:DNA-directed RNA polymerase specialized sigma24 family protein